MDVTTLRILILYCMFSDERRMMIHTVWKKMTQDQHKRYSQAFQNWKIWGGDGVEVLNELLEKEERK